MSFESFQLGDEEIQNLMSVVPPPETGNSFTALLELPANQAVKLLHSPEETLPGIGTSSILPIPIHNHHNSVKQEPTESDSLHISSDPVTSKLRKRKEREKKVRCWAKKIKSAKEKEGENLPYVHVRARRGEATDSHSLAERARREKINARMKLLQELVPGCNKISGTAMVLEEIINHVQSLQRQVEFLSMRLATIHPIIDINLDALVSSESGSIVDCMVSPSWWLNEQVNGNTELTWHRDGLPSFITSENSLLNYLSFGNSASLLTNQMKRES